MSYTAIRESKIIKNEPCPECQASGHDSTGNHLWVFADGGKYCKHSEYHSTRQPFIVEAPHSAGGSFNFKPKGLSQVKSGKELLKEISELPFDKLSSRGISKATAEHFGIRVGYDEATGEQAEYYYPIYGTDGNLLAYRVRELPKTFRNVGEKLKGVQVQLFGQDKCRKNGKRLVITEGQDDMLAAYQMLKAKYPNSYPNVCSLTHGANLQSVSDNLDFILGFDEVVLCFDNDDAGKKVLNDVVKLIGSRTVKVMKISEKDANDMLLKGKSDEFNSAFYNASEYIPDGILRVEDVYDEAIEMPTWGRSWAWPSLDKLTYGRRPGEGIYVGAAVKAGKTLWLAQMVQHIITTDMTPVFMVKFEQSPGATIKEIAGKLVNKQFHKPDGDFTQQELIEAVNMCKDKVLIFDVSYKDIGVTNVWDRLKPAIRHAVLVEGCKDVFIDPITQLTDGMTAADTDVELRRFSNEIAAMAKDLGFFYYCFCHLKAPESGETHESGAPVKVAQFRGSRAMAEKCKYTLGIIRDQYAEDPEVRNTSFFHLLLNSAFGKTGKFPVYFDDETGTYLERVRSVKGSNSDEY